MAACKVTWSHRALIQLEEILQFYADRNKSKTYSQKLRNRIKSELQVLKRQPEMGVKTTNEDIRGLIVGEFILFYKYTSPRKINIELIWDCRQNPDALRI